jgi:tRNA nucleotidyltransferase/poly(A) polymerase
MLHYIHPLLKEVAGIFSGAGKQVFLVGGAVRDMLRGEKASDWDLATDASPEEVTALFSHVIPTGIKHGTVTVLFKQATLEVSTFRTEAGYADGRHPDTVSWAGTITTDLSRRDFTMNALAIELPSGRLVDPFAGRHDIKERCIRCVGNPSERFAEDGLRALRAVRFAAQLDFSVEPATLAAIPACLPVTAKVSPERLRSELDKIIGSSHPLSTFILMEKTGLLELLLPELAQCRGVDQRGYHRFDVLDHSLLACDYAARHDADQTIRLAALLHDVGKPAVRALKETNDAGVWTFHQHEKVSAALTQTLMSRLRYPNATIEAVVHLVKEHMFHYTDDWTTAAVRRFILRIGAASLPALYQLRAADCFATTGTEPPFTLLSPLIDRVDAVLAEQSCVTLRNLALSGRDLLALNIPSGPRIGIILNELLETVLDDPALNTKEKLREIAINLNTYHEGLAK